MFASKTTSLLKRVLWAKTGQNRKVLVVKPRFDTRYATDKIVTHDGLTVDCLAIATWNDVQSEADNAEIVFFDEIQFFEEPHFSGDIMNIVNDLLRTGKDVVVNGLDIDTDGRPFGPTGLLMAMADAIHKLKSNCAVCGRHATKTYKLAENDSRIELGSVGLYEPRCNEHWTPRQ
jgi:thymidine kinase